MTLPSRPPVFWYLKLSILMAEVRPSSSANSAAMRRMFSSLGNHVGFTGWDLQLVVR